MTIERGLTVFFLIVSTAYLYASLGFSTGSLSAPKSGFTPQVVGMLAVFLCLVDLIATFRRSPAPGEPSRLLVAAAFIGGMVLYVVMLPLVGFLVATIVCAFLLLKFSGVSGYLLPAAISAALSGAVWVGFGMLLNIRLP